MKNLQDNRTIYRSLLTIRRFEETVLENFARGVFFGTTHTCLGQEANAVGALVDRQDDDIVFSNHRGHGHFLAYGGDPYRLFAELMGKASGVCGGRGGSQHLQWRNFYSNGVQGGIAPVATGMALAEKERISGAIVFAFLGDGTLGEGVLYEAFNLASLWGAPIFYILENNHIAQTTPTSLALAGSIAARFTAFSIPVCQLETSDVQEIRSAAGQLSDEVRQRCSPRALIVDTWRFGPHSKGDDTRSLEEIDALRRAHDPISIQARRLSPAERREVEQSVEHSIQNAFLHALKDPLPDPVSLDV